MLGGKRLLPAVYLAGLLAALQAHLPWVFVFGSAGANMLEAYLGYWLLRRYANFTPPIKTLRDFALIMGLGGFIPAFIIGVSIPLALLVAGSVTAWQVPELAWLWWRADVLGIAFFTPMILVFARPTLVRFGSSSVAWWMEVGLLWALSLMVGLAIFWDWVPPTLTGVHAPGIAWIFPLVIWSGLRTGTRNTGLLQLMFLGLALTSAHLKLGVFADEFSRYGLVNFWAFAMLLTVAGMGLAVASKERTRDHEHMALHAKLFEVTNDGVLIVDEHNNILSVNPSFSRITGYAPQEVLGRNPRMLSSGQQSRQFYQDMHRSLRENGKWEGELWNRRKDGVAYLARLSIQTLLSSRRRVRRYVGIFTDITQSRAAMDQVSHQAQHDFLTDLPNRLLFRDRFTQHLATAKRNGTKFAVIYLDLDGFKPVNDALGHASGDELLIQVAQRLRSLVREYDTVSRFGGDEFAILASEVAHESDVAHLAQKLLCEVRQPFRIGAETVTISCSIGIALYPDHGADLDSITHQADAALYQAKASGKNRASFCGPDRMPGLFSAQ